MKEFFLIILNFLLVIRVFGANFLILSSASTPSHHIWNRVLMEGLAANKDHNLTIVAADIDKKTLPNMHYIHLEKIYDVVYDPNESFDIMHYTEIGPIETVTSHGFWTVETCKGIFQSEGLKTILNYPDDFKFDAVIYDYTAGPCLLPLIHKFKYPPLISITAFSSPSYKNELIGGHHYPAYVPHYSLKYGMNMNFFQRIMNTFMYKYEEFYRLYILMPKIDTMARKRFGFQNIPSLLELQQKTVLMLTNNNFAFDFPEPSQPNVVEVGGLQLIDPKPLPEDIKTFIEKGKKGTVLMSLGTNMQSTLLGEDRLVNIITAFKEIPEYNFVWKFEDDSLPIEKPKNVMISKFLPQNGILAHPHIKAFISHSGMLSTHESMWHGKPVISMPFFDDQHRTSERLLNLEVGERIYFKTLTKEKFKEIILNVLGNKKYMENAQKISKRFQDLPEKPLQKAIWWIEYILRNPNPQHLQSPTLTLGFLASNSYDVILFVIAVIFSIVYLIRKILFSFRKSTKNLSITKKKN